ncbi:glycosyltransferase family 4 protein [Phenylobacterium sp.]|uniref:glycosyltransferase family 4 protein n=1 Tax=Phenylobacterium sp. TaxID=1871053 RepID=UPI0025DA1675|nr:glycosyltransferase family 4 protein [Phenylobacterium sp.]
MLGVKIQGGYSSEARVFARLLGHRGHAFDARVLYHSHDGESWREFEADAQAPVVRLDVGYREQMPGMAAKAKALLRFRRRLGELTRLARAYDPDVVYSSQQFWDCAAASHIARRLQRPHVIHLHYVVGPWLSTGFSRNPTAMRLATRAFGLADPVERLKVSEQVIAISDFIRHDAIAQGVPADRIATVHNPVIAAGSSTDDRGAMRAALDLPPGAPVIGIVGRLDVGKGHLDTLHAFARLAPANPDAHLVMVGGGPLDASLRAEAQRLGVAERVRFTGWRNDVPALLSAMDVFAHPSRREPFGLAVAEASAAGLPVIAYAEGAIPEIVVDGQTGWLTPEGDVAELAEALGRALAQPSEARRMGANGRELIERRFAPANASRGLAEVLSRLIGREPATVGA